MNVDERIEQLKAQQQCGDADCACQSDSDSALVHCVFPENHNNGDSQPSLSIFEGEDGQPRVECHAGTCDWKEIREALGLRSNGRSPSKGLSVQHLAEAKGLDEDFLEELGVTDEEWKDGTHLVSFPYYDASGKVVAHRRRFSLTGSDRFRWVKGDKPLLFGVQRLSDEDTYVVLVEGETDAITLLHLGISALGVPGAKTWKSPWAELIREREVFVWKEPDMGGEALVPAVLKDLPNAKVIEAPAGVKDANALWLSVGQDEERFGEEFARLLEAAEPQTGAATSAPSEDLIARLRDNPPDVAQALEQARDLIRRYVVLNKHELNLLALWSLHTHSIDAVETTPYIAITSAEKRCGKTRLLEVLSFVVKNPWLTMRTSPAALYRKIHRDHPTLLLDESDTAFASDREYAEALRGILNSGFRLTGAVTVCAGQGTNIEVVEFSTFSPKAIAGIGSLPDTVEDRSIPVVLQRKKPDEKVERLRHKIASKDTTVRDALAEAAIHLVYNLNLAEYEPELPDELGDRAQDVLEPLFAIADLAGGKWPQRARLAALDLLASGKREEQSDGVLLLKDIQDAFDDEGDDRIPSTRLLDVLNNLEESPWGSLDRGHGLTSQEMARRLRPFGIQPKSYKPHDGRPTTKGYLRENFADAWERYLR